MISIDTDHLFETLKQSIRINSILPHEEPQAVYFAEKIGELGIEPEGTRDAADANIYVAEGGIPTITIGPGGQGAHEAGEFVRVSTLEPVAKIYAETTARFLRNTA